MSSDVVLLARVRKLLEAIDAEPAGNNGTELVTNQQLELLVAQGSVANEETVRVGRAFYVNTTTAVASVVALPTTAVSLALYNNEPDSGKCGIIDWVGAINIVSGAATGTSEIIANLGQVRETPPTDAGLVIKRANGMGPGKDSRMMTIVGGTALPAATGIAAQWFPLGSAVGKTGAVAVGVSIFIPVDGRFIVPPGRYFALHTFSDIVTNTFQVFVGWHEKQINLG